LAEVNKSDNGNTAANHKVVAPSVHQIELPSALNVRQLADSLNVSAVEIIKQLMRQGIMANINQVINYDMAAAVAKAMGYESLQQPMAVPTADASSKR
jgi:hypothetical protein